MSILHVRLCSSLSASPQYVCLIADDPAAITIRPLLLGNGEFGVMPPAEYDGDPAAIVHEFDSLRS
ncbi:MAG: hypothetical protein ACLPIG_19980 [Methylocella sp.]